jgi:hypothetical protein
MRRRKGLTDRQWATVQTNARSLVAQVAELGVQDRCEGRKLYGRHNSRTELERRLGIGPGHPHHPTEAWLRHIYTAAWLVADTEIAEFGIYTMEHVPMETPQ